MRRHFVAGLIICLTVSIPLWARVPAQPGFEDVRNLAEHAPLVFRGRVVDVKFANKQAYAENGHVYSDEGVAVIWVDRWYRGSSSGRFVNLHFVYNDTGAGNGHDCSDLEIGSYWIAFAMPGAGEVLEMFDDCEGALRVSSLLGPKTSGGFLSQMEEDFAAGLDDSTADARIISIQRLAGLAPLGSTEALHRVIAAGSEEESKWAIFAALKTGDASVLPVAVPLLLQAKQDEAEGAMALAILKLRAPEAVPSLRRLANEASDGFVRYCAAKALREIKRGRTSLER